VYAIDLTGRRALVTGGGTGIGRAISQLLARAGARVVVHYRESRAQAEETVAAIAGEGGQAYLVQGDVAVRSDVERFVREAVDWLGGTVDILVNNAGTLIRRATLREMTPELWERTIAVNLTSAFHVTQAALPHLRRPGARIVNVTSIAAHTGGGPGALAYASAKAGLIAFTRAVAKELAPEGITCNALSPGTIMTRFHEQFSTPERLQALAREIPLGRIGVAEECAGAVLYLVSPLADYVTGEVIEVNGGQYFA
jgi:3-oxoacyl-[acyl-carrier protein] reductase